MIAQQVSEWGKGKRLSSCSREDLREVGAASRTDRAHRSAKTHPARAERNSPGGSVKRPKVKPSLLPLPTQPELCPLLHRRDDGWMEEHVTKGINRCLRQESPLERQRKGNERRISSRQRPCSTSRSSSREQSGHLTPNRASSSVSSLGEAPGLLSCPAPSCPPWNRRTMRKEKHPPISVQERFLCSSAAPGNQSPPPHKDGVSQRCPKLKKLLRGWES